jgi:hypothetical protein
VLHGVPVRFVLNIFYFEECFMKQSKWIFGIVLTALLALLAGCDLFATDEEGTDNGTGTGGVDFSSHNTDYSVLVRNNTGERLVAFKGELTADKLLGGIPAHANGHGLPYKAALFDKTEDFPLILLTEAQYEANKNNLNSQRNAPFTRVYVFYNKNGDNTVVYELAAGLGGINELSIVNPSTSMNIELRLGGVAGETIGYAPAGILDTKLKLIDGNYNIFPVFKRYNNLRDVVETVYPKGTSGAPWYTTISFGDPAVDQGVVRTYSINLRTVLQNLVMTSGAVWVYVNNQTASGVRFTEGGNVHKTASGMENVMTTRTFQIDMPKLPGTNNYQDSLTVSNWAFGPVGEEKALQVSATDSTPKGSFTINRDTMYTVTVDGDHNAGTLYAYISETTTIPLNDFTMNN